MQTDSYLETDKIRASGLPISIGKPMTSGPLLRLAGHEEIADGITDLPTLSQYAEIEIVGLNGAPSTYFLPQSFIDRPQIFLGFEEGSGGPVLVDVKDGTKGHLLLLGQSQTGKSSEGASIMKQV